MPVFTFLNGALLAALAAVAAPLLIHLLSRRRLPEVPIASTWLLREARRENIRHLRLHDYIVLLLRTLIVALVVLAAARPAMKLAGVFGAAGGGAVVVVLDATVSMTALAPDGSSTVFDRARRRAEEIVRQSGADDAVLLIVARGSSIAPREIVRGRAAVLAALQRATAAQTTGALGAAIGDAVRSAAAQQHANREVYVVSDFQQAALADVARDTRGAGDADVRVVLVPACDAPRGNIAVERVQTSGGNPPRIEATVANHTPDEVTIPVDASEPGHRPRRVSTRIAARARGVAVFAGGASAAPAGVESAPAVDATQAGEVRLPPDALNADNVRYFVPGGRGTVRTLLVGRDTPAPPAGGLGATDFPRLALSTSTGSGPSFAVQTGSPAALGDLDPSRVDVVVLANPPRLSAQALQNLRSYRAGGGSVFVSLGPQSDPASLNAELLPALSSTAIRAAAEIERTNGSYLSLLPTNPGHPVFAGFRLGAGAALTGARFTHCIGLNAGAGARILARFSDGTPALVESDGVLVFGSSLDLSWGDFATSGSFLPFLQQATAYLVTGRARPAADYVVGDRIPIRSVDATPRALVRCDGPAGASVAVESRTNAGRAALVTEPIPAPGVWTLRAGTRVLERVAVNIDPRESDLSRPKDADLLRTLARRNVSVLSPSDRVASYIGKLRHGRELWRECLIAALVLLVIEQWLSRSRARPAPAEGASRAA